MNKELKNQFYGRDEEGNIIQGNKCIIDGDKYFIVTDDGVKHPIKSHRWHWLGYHELDTKPSEITTHEKVRELQNRLVQTCIDFINENKLTDIWGVSFNADDLNTSAAHGEWTPATDSYIRVEGIESETYGIAARYTIDECM